MELIYQFFGLGHFFSTPVWNYLHASSDKPFLWMGITLLALSFLVTIAFYYWPINHPKFCNWWAWLVTALCCGALNLIVGWCMASHYLVRLNNKADALTGGRLSNPDTKFTAGDAFEVGFENMVLGILFFALFSLALNWWSRNAKYAPFRK